jgi:hypothetical protein
VASAIVVDVRLPFQSSFQPRFRCTHIGNCQRTYYVSIYDLLMNLLNYLYNSLIYLIESLTICLLNKYVYYFIYKIMFLYTKQLSSTFVQCRFDYIVHCSCFVHCQVSFMWRSSCLGFLWV